MRAPWLLVVALVGCGPTDGRPAADPDASEASDAGDGCVPGAPAAPQASQAIKVCQLTGEHDRHLNVPVLNRTQSTADLWGTDLGASFDHGGQTFFLFGDTLAMTGRFPTGMDSIAVSSDEEPDDCVALSFLSDRPDGAYTSPHVPGVDLTDYHVPLDGISADGSIYAWFSTGPPFVMDRSVLARSDDAARSWRRVRDEPSPAFVNVSATTIDGAALGLAAGPHVVTFGSGRYRASDVQLAVTPLAALEDPEAIRYFAGGDDAGCRAAWTDDPAGARAVIDTAPLGGPDGCVGELSVHYSAPLGKWVALYNCGEPRGIVLQTARRPWGPWSPPVLAFDPAQGGYCVFIHTDWRLQRCDAVHDPGRENEFGGEYGPYVVERYTHDLGDRVALYFVMSTWNPYNTVLMRTEVVK